MSKKQKTAGVPAAPFGQRIESSEYFRLLTSNFENMIEVGNGKERAYVSALSLCFNVERAENTDVTRILEDHAFEASSAYSLGFVIARDGFIKFCVRDCQIPGVSKRRIRGITASAFEQRFGRAPMRYGPSDMWCTLAEWYILLSLGRPPQLPKAPREFAVANDVDLP